MPNWRDCLTGVWIASVANLGICGNALAQSNSWSGLYAGIQMGASVGASEIRYPYDTHSGMSFAGGLLAGYNFRSGVLVSGFEVDSTWRGNSDGSKSGPADAGALRSYTTEQSWLMTLRARYGALISPQTLAYITFGPALGKVDHSATLAGPGLASTGGGASRRSLGWSLGGGFEWGLDSHWSLKAEYLYVDLGATSVITPPSASFVATKATFIDASHLWRGGLNYKF